MKRVVASSLLLLGLTFLAPLLGSPTSSFSFVQIAEAAVSVKGYYKKNGTYVAPHMRSNPDGNPYNNWSYPRNTNPYTGKTATGNPSTYLNNYYNGGSSYTAPSISIPSYVPSYSPIPSYTPSYSPTPSYSFPSLSTPSWQSCSEFGLGARYNYLNEKCECGYGYTARNNRCVSDDDACSQDYGYNSRSTLGNKCTCSYGYRFNSAGNKCISNESYCQELDWNAKYDYLKSSCVCKDGYKAGITGSSCVLDSSSTPSYAPSYQYTCPANSYENPLNPSKCLCNTGYEIGANGSSCVRTSYPTSSASSDKSECGANMHGNRGGCDCNTGYALNRNNVGCAFVGCPAGYSVDSSGSCQLRANALSDRVACLTKKPCTCPSGYEAMGNRICVRK